MSNESRSHDVLDDILEKERDFKIRSDMIRFTEEVRDEILAGHDRHETRDSLLFGSNCNLVMPLVAEKIDQSKDYKVFWYCQFGMHGGFNNNFGEGHDALIAFRKDKPEEKFFVDGAYLQFLSDEDKQKVHRGELQLPSTLVFRLTTFVEYRKLLLEHHIQEKYFNILYENMTGIDQSIKFMKKVTVFA